MFKVFKLADTGYLCKFLISYSFQIRSIPDKTCSETICIWEKTFNLAFLFETRLFVKHFVSDFLCILNFRQRILHKHVVFKEILLAKHGVFKRRLQVKHFVFKTRLGVRHFVFQTILQAKGVVSETRF